MGFTFGMVFGTERKQNQKTKNSASGIMPQAVDCLKGDFLFSGCKQKSA